MDTIKFYIGEENGVVVEKNNFTESIFAEQYKQAIKVIGGMLDQPKNENPNIMAFCGDRGEGKTSCMCSVMDILRHKEEGDYKSYVDEISYGTRLKDFKIEVLEMIDPAFFDKKRNLLEHVLGQLYNQFRDYVNNDETGQEKRKRRTAEYEKIIELFQKVKECLHQLDTESEKLYDPLEELSVFSMGIQLHKWMSDLFKAYLVIKGLSPAEDNNGLDAKAKILITVDDIDLNVYGAYTMVEQVRKYLNNPYCIIAISVKVDQLVEVIENNLKEEFKYHDKVDVRSMAQKYVTKLIPLGNRINMPKAYDICNQEIVVYDNRDSQNEVFKSKMLKLGLVRLIYSKVRFLFYNSKGGVSPIVPNNLRSMRHLLGMLLSMDDSISITNKKRFLNYFYNTWSSQLTLSDYNFVQKVVSISEYSAINKYVVKYLTQCYQGLNLSELESAIMNAGNYSYNVSVGDVFCLLNKLERSTTDASLKNLLFFVRSFYGIKLYELYDNVTEDENWDDYFPAGKDDSYAYRTDAWFNVTNDIQQLVSSGYFSYAPNELLAPSKDGARDFIYIDGAALNSLIKKIAIEYRKDNTAVLDKGFQDSFKLIEFFALTISRSIQVRDVQKYAVLNRENAVPAHLSSFNEYMGAYVFDIMYPFTSLLNVKFAYNRFAFFPEMFDIALNNEWSLLRQMIKKVRLWRKRNDNPDFKEEELTAFSMEKKAEYIHDLLSNATIRNGEILSALYENIKVQRFSIRSTSDNNQLIAEFYKRIRSSKMQTFNKGENERQYIIEFSYLDAITEFLSQCNISEFDSIFVGKRSVITDQMVTDTFRVVFARARWKEISGQSVIKKLEMDESIYHKLSAEKWLEYIDLSQKYEKKGLIDVLRPLVNVINSNSEI